MLPLCECAIRVKDFIRVHSRFEYGLVSHAFSSALSLLLDDFNNIIIQLECLLTRGNQMLTLQKMVYFLQPSKVILRLLDKLCSEYIKDATGGLLIDILYQCVQEQGVCIYTLFVY